MTNTIVVIIVVCYFSSPPQPLLCSPIVSQSITGVSISDLSTPVSLANFQMAIVKAVAYSLNLYSVGGNVSPPGNPPPPFSSSSCVPIFPHRTLNTFSCHH